MISFYRTPQKSVIAVASEHAISKADSDKLCWLFGDERRGNYPKHGPDGHRAHRGILPRGR